MPNGPVRAIAATPWLQSVAPPRVDMDLAEANFLAASVPVNSLMTSALARTTLTDRTSLAIRETLAGRRRGLATALLFAGPAVVSSIAYMDPGNFATNIQAGAGFGYSLLWVVLAANLIAMLFQALAAKLGIVTGRNLAEMCRER